MYKVQGSNELTIDNLTGNDFRNSYFLTYLSRLSVERVYTINKYSYNIEKLTFEIFGSSDILLATSLLIYNRLHNDSLHLGVQLNVFNLDKFNQLKFDSIQDS